MAEKSTHNQSAKNQSLLQSFELHFEYDKHIDSAKKELHARTSK